MNITSFRVLIISVIILAIVIDLFLMQWMHRHFQKKYGDSLNLAEGVTIFGSYSPILTWLRKVGKALLEKTKDSQKPVEQKEDYRSTKLFAPHNPFVNLMERMSWLNRWGDSLQLFLLILGVLFYCRGILNFQTNLRLPGNESEYFQYDLQFFVQSLLQDHQFPTWNPYLHTGLPYLADPMLNLYNPVITLPCLVFGVRIGYRIALVLSYILAAIGMMKLGKAFGFNRLVTLWLGFMYAFSSQPTARFFSGQYLFIFGFAWIPWVFYFLIQYKHNKEVKTLVYFACSLALLYFCGNAYFTFLIFWFIILFVFVFAIEIYKKPLKFKLNSKFIYSIVAACLLCGGVIAVNFLPMLQFRPFMVKGEDVLGSHTPFQIWLDYTSKDTLRPDAYSTLPAREEFYAYIGYVPFLALLLLPFGWRRGQRRWILYWLSAILFVVLWIDVDCMPWRNFYYQASFFNQFRYVLRMMIFGGLAIFVLGAFGIDGVWKYLLRNIEHIRQGGLGLIQMFINSIGIIGLVVLMGYGVYDTYQTNHVHIFLEEDYQPAYRVTQWLKQYDNSDYYVRHNPVGSWHLAMLSSRLKYIDAWYHWTDIRRFDDPQLNNRPVEATPLYFIQSSQDKPPEGRWQIVKEIEGNAIYKMSDSLPIAFKTPLITLQANENEKLKNGDVIALTPFFIKNDAIEIIANGSTEDVLVVLVTHYPGWQVKVDGRNAVLDQAGGYLAVKMKEGTHRYQFEFHPTLFYLGLIISLVCLGIILFIIRSDIIALGKWLKKLITKIKDFRIKLPKRKVKLKEGKTIFNPAVYQQGMFVIEKKDLLENGSKVDLVILPKENTPIALSNLWRIWKQLTTYLLRSWLSAFSFISILFGLSIVIYFSTRMINLANFPIYFFTDEAIQTVSAADLVRDHFMSPDGILLPTYFQNGNFYNLSLSVYAQVIPYLLFGKSVIATRSVSVVISLVTAICLALCFKYVGNEFFNSIGKSKAASSAAGWWSIVLFLSITPAWFLHSRTAFETVLFCSFFGLYFAFYLLYRYRSPKYIFLVVLFCALAFYSYSPGQVVLAAFTLGLFFSDFRYHWQNRKILCGAIGLGLVFLIPYFRFLSYHSNAPFEHLRNLDSYWMYPIPLSEKILRFLREYLNGLNPYYWFIPNDHDLVRHVMKGYGNLGLFNLPFILIGLIVVLKHLNNSANRTVLLAILSAPMGSALVGIGITRVLVMVIPIIFLAGIGWQQILNWISEPRDQNGVPDHLWHRVFFDLRKGISHINQPSAQAVLFIILAAVNLYMLWDITYRAPTWFEDYGLYGMQYGSRQIFQDVIPEIIQSDSRNRLFVSSLWANGADVFIRFFLPEEYTKRLMMGSIDAYLSQKQPVDDHTIFILTAEEFRQVLMSPKMRFLGIIKTIPYPNGKDGFYVVRLDYVKNVDEIFAAEKEARRKLIAGDLEIQGNSAHVLYSQINSGQLSDAFDGDVFSLIRGIEANPFIFDFNFSQSLTIQGISADFGSMDFEIKVILYNQQHPEGLVLTQTYSGLPPDPHIELLFPEPYRGNHIRLEILSLSHEETAQIHIREIHLIQ